MIALLIPVLGRPQNAQALVESVQAHTTMPFGIVFLASRGDDEQIEACRSTNAITQLIDGGDCEYARKINLGCTLDHWGTPPEWYFLGADDLAFRHGWDLEAVAEYERTGKPVIGTNDLGNATVMAGLHATHSLVRRSYVEQGTIDGQPGLLHEGYSHNFCDTEFVETAKHRGAFSFAFASHVEHLHPFWGKSESDVIYLKGQKGYHKDRRLYQMRSRLWRRERRA